MAKTTWAGHPLHPSLIAAPVVLLPTSCMFDLMYLSTAIESYDESGGLPRVLTLDVAPGKQPSLAPEVLASIEAALHQPYGFESYYDLQAWVKHTHGVVVKHKTLYTSVRQRFKTKLKVPRPSHTKKG